MRTPGEMWRTILRIEQAINQLREDMLRELQEQLTLRLSAQTERIDRLEKVVYGLIAVVLAGLTTAALTHLIHG